MPKRVQIQAWRKPGGKKPENVVIVARPSKWGNPFKVDGNMTAAEAVDLYRHLAEFGDGLAADARAELRGKDLACYCAVINQHGNYVPCHADVLISLANDIPLEEVINENTRRAKGETL